MLLLYNCTNGTNIARYLFVFEPYQLDSHNNAIFNSLLASTSSVVNSSSSWSLVTSSPSEALLLPLLSLSESSATEVFCLLLAVTADNCKQNVMNVHIHSVHRHEYTKVYNTTINDMQCSFNLGA